jgi:hypothetical protein
MKKVLIVICISAFLASCGGDSTKSTDVTKDSTSVSTDSSRMSSPATSDTTSHTMKDSSSNKMATDTTKK